MWYDINDKVSSQLKLQYDEYKKRRVIKKHIF